MWMPRNLSRRTLSPDSGSLTPSSRTMALNLIASPSEDIAAVWELQIDILHQLIPKGMDKPRLLTGHDKWTQEEVG